MTASDLPLLSDNCHQARLHSGQHGRRRQLLGLLIADAEAAEAGRVDQTAPLTRKLSNRILGCGAHPVIWQGETSGRLCISRARCKSRVCPTCGIMRSRKVRDRLTEIMKHMDEPRLLTLTLKATSEPLEDQLKKLNRCWRKVRQRKEGKRHVKGGFQVTEVTWNARTAQWHPHLHIVFDGHWWSQARLADLWENVTGDSRIVDIRVVHGASKIARYITSYISKSQVPTDVPAGRIGEWAKAVHGARMVQTFGSLHGVKLTGQEEPPKETLGLVCHLVPLMEASSRNDEEATQLIRQLHQLANIRTATGVSGDAQATAAAECGLAERLRAWWASFTGDNSDHAPPGIAARTGPNCADQGTLWLREELFSPSALCEPH